ncbi:acyl-CoA dehydrogenase family protein [Mariniluteicoccus flavus]
MHFAPTDDHREMTDLVRELLADRCTPDVVREAWESGPPRALWSELADIGVLGALVGEDDGGMGLDETFLVLLAREIGYAAVPLPVTEAMCLGPVLAHADAEAWAAVSSGEKIATWGDHDLVGWGGVADLVVAREGSTLVRPSGEARPLPTTDGGRPVAAYDPEGGTPLEVDLAAHALLEARATLATAGQLVGLGRRMIDLAVAYVKEREQFGQPIGAFQAVKHHLATALVDVEFAEPVALAAAWMVAHDGLTPGVLREVAAAKLLAARAASGAARHTIQVHGGMGYTTEYDLHLYAKRAWALVPGHGTPAVHRAAIAQSLGL